DCGMWIDRPINEAEWLTEDECPLPPSVPADWMEDAEVTPQDIEEYSSEHDAENALTADPALAADLDALQGGVGRVRAAEARAKGGAAAEPGTNLRQAKRLSRLANLPSMLKPEPLPAGSQQDAATEPAAEEAGSKEITASGPEVHRTIYRPAQTSRSLI